MIILIDNTVLSNFALVNHADLLHQALGTTAATTVQVMDEFERGMELHRVPITDWNWLSILPLSDTEQLEYQKLLKHLNAGEASCLAMAANRQAQVLTDDRDARILARQMRISVGGTLGVLTRLIEIAQLPIAEANHLLDQMIKHGYRSPVEKLEDLL